MSTVQRVVEVAMLTRVTKIITVEVDEDMSEDDTLICAWDCCEDNNLEWVDDKHWSSEGTHRLLSQEEVKELSPPEVGAVLGKKNSTGKTIVVGDKVKFKGRIYTIKKFHPGEGRWGLTRIEFEEPQHTNWVADVRCVDKVV